MPHAQVQRLSGLWYSAEYSTFSISDEAGDYQLSLAGYSGDAGDALSNPDWRAVGKKFSTFDNDNDDKTGPSSCAVMLQGGWWFVHCSVSNLNHPGVTFWSDDPSPVPDVPVSRMLVKVY